MNSDFIINNYSKKYEMNCFSGRINPLFKKDHIIIKAFGFNNSNEKYYIALNYNLDFIDVEYTENEDPEEGDSSEAPSDIEGVELLDCFIRENPILDSDDFLIEIKMDDFNVGGWTIKDKEGNLISELHYKRPMCDLGNLTTNVYMVHKKHLLIMNLGNYCSVIILKKK